MIKHVKAYYTKHKKSLNNTFLIYASNIITLILTAVATKILSNALDKAAFGGYNFIINLVIFFTVIFDFGLISITQRLISSAKGKYKKEHIKTVFLLSAIIFVIMVVFILISSYFIDRFSSAGIGGIIRKLNILLIYYPLSLFLFNILISGGDILFLNFSKIASRMIFVFGIFLLAHKNISIFSALAMNSISTLIFVVLYYVKNFGISLSLVSKSLKKIKDLLFGFGIRMYLTGLVGAAISKFDIFIVPFFLGLDTSGQYFLALTIATPVKLIGESFAQANLRDMAGKKILQKKHFIFLIIFIILSVLGFWIFNKLITKIISNESFVLTAKILPFVAIAFGIRAINSFFYGFFTVNKFIDGSRTIFVSGLVFGFFMLFTMTLLTKYFGVFGSAISLIISEISMLLVFCLYYNRLCFRKF